MARRYIYFITEGEDKEEARDNVAHWLSDYLGREFYEGYEVSDTDIKRVHEVEPGFFEKALYDREKLAVYYRSKIEYYAEKQDRFMTGRNHVCLGHILMGSFCEDMPFWNLLKEDWTLPEPDNWAVMVGME
jgi:hypothetical protein